MSMRQTPYDDRNQPFTTGSVVDDAAWAAGADAVYVVDVQERLGKWATGIHASVSGLVRVTLLDDDDSILIYCHQVTIHSNVNIKTVHKADTTASGIIVFG